MKVLHVFDHSLPHHSGYSFRSESILKSLRACGVQTSHLTSAKHVHDGALLEMHGELEFFRCPTVISGSGPYAQLRCIAVLRKAIRELVAQEHPDVIHCHSPCLNGLAALGLGVPVLYEVRACWEDAAVASGTTLEGSARYRLSRSLETFVARAANELVVICDGLSREFERRGLAPGKISVVGNAVNPESLAPASSSQIAEFRRGLGLDERRVIGFFGSFYDYEGLDLLVESVPKVMERISNVTVLLAGGGEAEIKLREAVQRLGVGDQVRFLGRVPHEDIAKCYGIADVMVFPRRRSKLTDMVTPLKPLEAMYFGSKVVASDVGGHVELLRSGETGVLFEAGNVAALANALVGVLTNEVLAERIRCGGHEYVLRERLWSHMAERYRRIYARMIRDQRSRT